MRFGAAVRGWVLPATPEGCRGAHPTQDTQDRRQTVDLIVEGRGTFVGKHQGRLRVSREGKTITEAPIIHL